jgi:uncharacterized protein YlxW (UPF0749 family)
LKGGKKMVKKILILSLLSFLFFQILYAKDEKVKKKELLTPEEVVGVFLKNMDEEKYEEAYKFLDFEKHLKQEWEDEYEELSEKEKEKEIKNYKQLIKSLFLSRKTMAKDKNVQIKLTKLQKDLAEVEVISNLKTGGKTKDIFKLHKLGKEWKIYEFKGYTPKK